MQTVNTKETENHHDARHVINRFSLINRDRVQRIQDSLNESQQIFLDILPLLFHTNHPLLPGYVSKNTPFGISDYSPSDKTLNAAHRVTRSFKHNKRALRNFQIEGLYMMGSSGTIAYSQKSDFDIWVCHRKGLSNEALQELQQKAEAIEQWAALMRLEVHFFIFNAEEFCSGNNDGLSDEHSGSSQHYLLLDEFYRSGLVIAGLPPLWWVVPPEHEHDYNHYIASQTKMRFINARDFINFGGLDQIPAEEFFGATLWHLYKSINSPYKSVLKLMLMEVYADEYPQMDLLSSHYKRAIYDGVSDLEKMDTYLLMYRKVEDYLMSQNDSVRLDFLRRSFYLKVNEKLSEPKKANWRREVLELMVRSWGWETHQIQRLDNKNNWQLQSVLYERRDLIRTLTQSYRKLSQFARRQTSISHISQQDLNILGRRLYSAFEKKAGKIELVNRGITPDLYEKQVTISQYQQEDKPPSWLLYSGSVTPEQTAQLTPMKRTSSAMDLLAWCHFNKIVESNTLIQAFIRDSELTVREIRTIMAELNSLFPAGEIVGSTTSELSLNARIRQSVLFVNVGRRPRVSQIRDGDHLASSRNNALSYGGLHENLALSFDLLIETTWQEIFCFHYSGIEGLIEALSKYLCYESLSSDTPLAPISIRCFSEGYGMLIQNSIEQIIKEAAACFKPPASGKTRYLLQSANEYHILQIIDDVPKYSHLANQQQLLRHLGQTQSAFCPLIFNADTLSHSPLPEIYRSNKPGRIQLYFRVIENTAHIYILDEMGSLYYQPQPFHDYPSLLNHYALFLMAIINRRQHTLHSAENHEEVFPLDFYECIKNSHKKFALRHVSYSQQDIPNRHFDVQVICTQDTGEHKNVTIYSDGHEFSTMEYGGELFTAVARHVMKFRRGKENYPVYITDIDLSESAKPMKNDTELQTAHFLAYKKSIEFQLNKAMQNL